MIRHIILIVIDCLRADHVHACGYERPTTPTLDALASDGILWDSAYSTSSWTRPAVTSMFTGQYASQHGVFQGIKRSKGRTAVMTDVLSEKCPTIAETLANAGWRCGAFINNDQLGEFTGLNRGFETYVPTAGKADRVIELFRDWIERDTATPSFSYLHFLESHWPYKPRRRHVAMFGGDRDTNYFRDFSARDFGRLRLDINRGEASLTNTQLEQMIQMYDGAVRRLDGKIKMILHILKEIGQREDCAVIVTADHGEEFLEHGCIGHGQSLYDELTHVPLVMWLPDGPRGVRITEPVSLSDLSHTLTCLAGADSTMPGSDLRSPAHDRGVFGEMRIWRRYTQFIRRAEWKLYRFYKLKLQDGEDVTSQLPYEWYQRHPRTIRYELYNLRDDPREQVDLSDRSDVQHMRNSLETELEQWWRTKTLDSNVCEEREMDDLVLQRLQDMGYIE